MPSAQVINFGEDPYANAMGNFAKSFLGELNERTAKRRNDEVFTQIKEKYGKDAKPEDYIMDVLEHHGLDQNYKNDTIGNITKYAELKNKVNKNGYDNAILKIRENELGERVRSNNIAEDRVKNQDKEIANKEAENNRKRSTSVIKYNADIMKDNANKFSIPESDISDWNYYTEDMMINQKKNLTEASRDALKLISMRREKIDNGKVTPRPTSFFGTPKGIPEAMEQAYQELKQMYDQDEITAQKDLRRILENSGWNVKPEELKKILSRVLQDDGRSLRGPQKSAEIPMAIQGKTEQAASIDDLLFGE